MSHTVDTIETKYKLTDDYSKKLGAIADNTAKTAKLLESAESKTKAFDSTLAKTYYSVGLLSNALGGLKSGIGVIEGLTSKALGFASAASEAATKIETTRATFKAMVGEARGKEIEAYTAKLAVPSLFTKEQLQQSAVQQMPAGLRPEWSLPLIAKMSMPFGHDDELLREATRMFTDMATGRMPEVEVLSRFGLNKRMFAEKGIQFSKAGELLSGTDELLRAAEQLINEKYGNIFEEMKDTTQAKLATIEDLWQQSMEKIGQSINNTIGPYLDKIGAWLDFVVNSGWLDRLGKGFEDAFAWAKNADWIDKPMTYLLAAAEKLPLIFGEAAKVLMHGVMEAGKYIMVEIVPFMSPAGVGSNISYAAALADVDSAKADIARQQKDWIKAHGSVRGLSQESDYQLALNHQWNAVYKLDMIEQDREKTKRAFLSVNGSSEKAALDDMQQYVDAAARRTGIYDAQKRIEAEWQAWKSRGSTGPAVPVDQHPEYGAFENGKAPWVQSSPALEAAKQVAQYTRETAANTRKMLDLRRMVFGGGALGELGITPVEMSGQRAARRSGTQLVQVEFPRGGTLERAIADIVQNVIAEMAVRRLLPTGG